MSSFALSVRAGAVAEFIAHHHGTSERPWRKARGAYSSQSPAENGPADAVAGRALVQSASSLVAIFVGFGGLAFNPLPQCSHRHPD